MSEYLDYFRAYLRQKGKSLTREAAAIVGMTLRRNAPFSCKDVVDQMSRDDVFPRLLVITPDVVRRTLSELEECGLLTRQGNDQYLPESSLIQALKKPKPPAFNSAFTKACSESHQSMIAGWCPWCGRPIMDGVVKAHYLPRHWLHW